MWFPAGNLPHLHAISIKHHDDITKIMAIWEISSSAHDVASLLYETLILKKSSSYPYEKSELVHV